ELKPQHLVVVENSGTANWSIAQCCKGSASSRAIYGSAAFDQRRCGLKALENRVGLTGIAWSVVPLVLLGVTQFAGSVLSDTTTANPTEAPMDKTRKVKMAVVSMTKTVWTTCTHLLAISLGL